MPNSVMSSLSGLGLLGHPRPPGKEPFLSQPLDSLSDALQEWLMALDLSGCNAKERRMAMITAVGGRSKWQFQGPAPPYTLLKYYDSDKSCRPILKYKSRRFNDRWILYDLEFDDTQFLWDSNSGILVVRHTRDWLQLLQKMNWYRATKGWVLLENCQYAYYGNGLCTCGSCNGPKFHELYPEHIATGRPSSPAPSEDTSNSSTSEPMAGGLGQHILSISAADASTCDTFGDTVSSLFHANSLAPQDGPRVDIVIRLSIPASKKPVSLNLFASTNNATIDPMEIMDGHNSDKAHTWCELAEDGRYSTAVEFQSFRFPPSEWLNSGAAAPAERPAFDFAPIRQPFVLPQDDWMSSFETIPRLELGLPQSSYASSSPPLASSQLLPPQQCILVDIPFLDRVPGIDDDTSDSASIGMSISSGPDPSDFDQAIRYEDASSDQGNVSIADLFSTFFGHETSPVPIPTPTSTPDHSGPEAQRGDTEDDACECVFCNSDLCRSSRSSDGEVERVSADNLVEPDSQEMMSDVSSDDDWETIGDTDEEPFDKYSSEPQDDCSSNVGKAVQAAYTQLESWGQRGHLNLAIRT